MNALAVGVPFCVLSASASLDCLPGAWPSATELWPAARVALVESVVEEGTPEVGAAGGAASNAATTSNVEMKSYEAQEMPPSVLPVADALGSLEVSAPGDRSS